MVLIFSEGKLINEVDISIFEFYRSNPLLIPNDYLFDTRGNSWYSCTFTPVLLADVPPNYRAMVLIYT